MAHIADYIATSTAGRNHPTGRERSPSAPHTSVRSPRDIVAPCVLNQTGSEKREAGWTRQIRLAASKTWGASEISIVPINRKAIYPSWRPRKSGFGTGFGGGHNARHSSAVETEAKGVNVLEKEETQCVRPRSNDHCAGSCYGLS